MKLSVRKSKKFIIKLAVLFFVGYCIYLFINQQVKIKIKTDEVNSINQQIAEEKEKTKEIRGKLDEDSNGQNERNSNTRVFENVAE